MFLITVKLLIISLLINTLFLPFANSRALHNATTTANPTEVEFNKRNEEILNWRCSTPKPRLVYVGDENRRQITPNSKWHPQAAVLHRCEKSSGCCTSYPDMPYTCMPTQTQEVSILFKKINMLNGHHEFERLSFTNHTSCACQSTTNI